jgi:predicted transcriptional regulator
MKDVYMTIKLDTPLRERVEALAQAERRSLADQAAYLMEKGLEWLEKRLFLEKRSVDAMVSVGELLSGERQKQPESAEEAI